MQVDWSESAIAKLIEIRAHIDADNPIAAKAMAEKLLKAGNSLEDFPNRGRPTKIPNVRELIVSGTPYFLEYQIEGNVVNVLSVWHSAQDRGSED